MTPATKRHLLSGLFFTWLATLLILTYFPNMPDTDVRVGREWFRTDYLGHAVFYAVLIILFLVWRQACTASLSGAFLAWTAAGGVLFGAMTEATQHFIPGRSLNPLDLMYNCIGIIAGILACLVFYNRTRVTRPPG